MTTQNDNFIKVRSSALLLIEVTDCNPNGDPDFDARPRTFPNGLGWISDVSVKRKIRNLFSDHDSPVFSDLHKLLEFNPEMYHILESLNRGSGINNDPSAAVRWSYDYMIKQGEEAFLDRYADVRWFGTTFLEAKKTTDDGKKAKGRGKKKEKEPEAIESTEVEEVSESMRFKKTGPVVISPAVSICPVSVIDATLSKMCPTNEEKLDRGVNDLAPAGKKFVRHGIYACRLEINPMVGYKTRTTAQDIEILKTTLKYIFHTSASASRTQVSFRHIWWADHKNALGSFNTNQFYDSLMPRRIGDPTAPSERASDYEFPQPSGDFANLVTDLC